MTRLLTILLLTVFAELVASGKGLSSPILDGITGGDSVFSAQETEMALKAKDILYGESDSVRRASDQDFSRMLLQVLGREGSFNYHFDSLTTISRLYAPDSSFRIFTWNLPKDDGTYHFSGMIQCRPMADIAPIYTLSDRSDTMDDIEHVVGGSADWPGAHYYQIILNVTPARKYYTLLGWDGHTRFTTRKIIEILTFDQQGGPVFGARVFPDYRKGDQTRVIFEYSSNATMSLKYETQRYRELRNKNPNRPRYRYITSRMIVFDHLEPMDPSVAGQYSFYIPVGNIVDAFVFKEGCWRFRTDIDARNPDNGPERDLETPIEYQLLPPAEQK